ncbi:MAG: class I SAM-dependent methyltransferase, partial [Bacteroidales bacterium]|nr:class I SAM-dependent methyltransferase [Bacteroidales bacterium]
MKIIFQYIARQFSRPTGFGGRISTFLMNRMNRLQYRCIAENISLSPSDTVLDIGFGNGYMMRQLAKKQPAKIFGIDI